MSEQLKQFARGIFSEFANITVQRLAAELRDLKVDPDRFTIVVAIVPRETHKSLECATTAFRVPVGLNCISGTDISAVNAAPTTTREQLEVVENELLNLSDAIDDGMLLVQNTLNELKGQPAMENAN